MEGRGAGKKVQHPTTEGADHGEIQVLRQPGFVLQQRHKNEITQRRGAKRAEEWRP